MSGRPPVAASPTLAERFLATYPGAHRELMRAGAPA